MSSIIRPLARREVVSQAWPLILANATTPLLGLTDTYVLGHGARAMDLAALSLGTLVFNFLYWSLGFLRMATTGFVAQALGSRRDGSIFVAVTRPLLVGAAAGVLLLIVQPWLSSLAFSLLGAEVGAEQVAQRYVRARIWGAPFHLAALSGMGLLIGLGKSRELLLVQLLTNGLNISLDVYFVSHLSWGAEGVGWGTAIAETLGGILCLSMGARELKRMGESFPGWSAVFERRGMARTFSANSDIMIRTLAMICGFAFFTDRAARFGTVVLAANQLLLQFISLSAFFLDGFAHVAEAKVGAAYGARSRARFDRAVRVTSELAAGCAFLLSGTLYLSGEFAVSLLTDLEIVRRQALSFLPQTALYVAVSVAAFQLDGVFIGASATRSMRNMALVSVAGFLCLAHWLMGAYGNDGLWWAFVGYVALRGLTLLGAFPRLRAELPRNSTAKSLERA